MNLDHLRKSGNTLLAYFSEAKIRDLAAALQPAAAVLYGNHELKTLFAAGTYIQKRLASDVRVLLTGGRLGNRGRRLLQAECDLRWPRRIPPWFTEAEVGRAILTEDFKIAPERQHIETTASNTHLNCVHLRPVVEEIAKTTGSKDLLLFQTQAQIRRTGLAAAEVFGPLGVRPLTVYPYDLDLETCDEHELVITLFRLVCAPSRGLPDGEVDIFKKHYPEAAKAIPAGVRAAYELVQSEFDLALKDEAVFAHVRPAFEI